MRLRTFTISCCVVLIFGTLAIACNIPVFRYALERWRPDKLELFVFHHGELKDTVGSQSSQQPASSDSEETLGNPVEAGLNRLNQRGANVDVKLVDLSATLQGSEAELWANVGAAKSPDSPYVVLRGKHTRGLFTCWSGPLADAKDLIHSPARAELSRRILAGHAVVWLTILSDDNDKNRPLLELLEAECTRLSDQIELPEGIGLPGSELYSEVPLFLKFSTLEIKRSDVREQVMLAIGKGFQPDAFAKGEPLVIPIFGRGRALEVIPGSGVSQALVEDITMFLCGACSCQVKDQNPGFDLPIAINWEEELYGEGGALAPPADSIRPGEQSGFGQGAPPVLLSIPPGRSKAKP